MAQYTAEFDVDAALAGAQNIWTRSGLPVVFGAYNPEATDPLEEVQVWVDGQPADYPIDGRKNDQVDDPLDLLMVTPGLQLGLNIKHGVLGMKLGVLELQRLLNLK